MTNIKYLDNGKTAIFNGKKYARDDRTGYYLCHDSAGSGSRLHRDVWRYYNCEIPKGYDIHHKDHDKGNNDIENLQLLKNKEHRKLHGEELTEKERDWRRNNVITNATPAAAEWHKSKEGKEWHRKHIKEVWDNKEPITYKCDNCGKEFKTLNTYSKNSNKFCCNACKSAYRRKSGVDNVERVCEFCGKTFICGKYQKRKYCSVSCSKKDMWRKRKSESGM